MDEEDLITESNKSSEFLSNNSSTIENLYLIKEFRKVEKCSILKYGIKPSTEEINYGFCLTCDVNLIHPICLVCLEKCHKNMSHQIKIIEKSSNIICGCGERMHKFPKKIKAQEEVLSRNCPYYNWCETSQLTTWYMIGQRKLCIFCSMICEHAKKATPVEYENENEIGEFCQCQELNSGVTHIDLKNIYKKIDEISKFDSEIMQILGPLKMINMMFMGRITYEKLYYSFDEMLLEFSQLNENHRFDIKENFLETNFFLGLKNFISICSQIKLSSICYFCTELSEKINFQLIEKVVKYVRFKETSQYWIFISNLLTLYKKVGICSYTSCMDKYKIYDLENFHFIQRRCLFHNNHSFFPDAKKQINFFIEMLSNYLDMGINLQEGYEGIIAICSILKLLSKFNLFSSKNMILFCFEFERCSDLFKRIKDQDSQLRLYIKVIKIMHLFILFYNDEIFYKYTITQNEEKKIDFIYTKNELGRLISRNVIKMMYFCQKNFLSQNQSTLTKYQIKTSKKIIRHGIKILSYLILPNDSFTYSIYKDPNITQNYYDIMKISDEDKHYKIFLTEVTLIENTYRDFFIFTIDEDIMIDKVFNSIKRVMNLQLSNVELKNLILKSNYFFAITKLFYICEFDPSNEIDITFLDGYFEFVEFFIEGNSDFAMLMMSHYFINALMKVPVQFSYDIFKTIDYCANLIVLQNKFINFSKHIIKLLFNYLLKLKRENGDKTKPNQENSNNQMYDGESDNAKGFNFESLLNLFLNIIIKLSLRIRQTNKVLTIKIVKKIIIKLLTNVELSEISHDNLKLILVISNRIFDSTEINDRKAILTLIPFNDILEILSDMKIDVDFRMEILIFMQKFKYNLYFSRSLPAIQLEDGRFQSRKNTRAITKKTNNPQTNKDNLNNNANINSSTNNNKNMNTTGGGVMTLTKKSTFHNSSNKILTKNTMGGTNGKYLRKESKTQGKIAEEHSLCPETKIKMDNDYLNGFGIYYDNFNGLTENPLISNFQYPTKFLTFFYNLIKVNSETQGEDENDEENNSIFTVTKENVQKGKIFVDNTKTYNPFLQTADEIDEESITIFENELKRFKDIYIKNSSNIEKFMNYLAKGLIVPLNILVKKIFCRSHICDGNKILTLYKIAMNILYIKNYLFELGSAFIENLKEVKISHINISCFFDKKNQIETLNDYFVMKNCLQFSPFDYTKLYLIFEKHLFSFVEYPKSLELNEHFASNNIDHLLVEDLNEDTCLIFENSEESELGARKLADSLFAGSNGNLMSLKNNNKNHVSLGKNNLIGTYSKDHGDNKKNNDFLITSSNNKEINKKSKNKINENELEANIVYFQNKEKNDIFINLKKIITIYKNKKNEISEKNSSLFTSLTEMCMEYEKNFREMLIVILINIANIEKQQYLSDCFMVLYKLLSIQTSGSQNDITDYLGGANSKNLGFLVEFSDILYEKIIKIFLGYFCIDHTYNEINQELSYNIIKIFKFLCEEHNNFFQTKILSKLEFKYNKWDNYSGDNFICLQDIGEEDNQSSMTFFNFMVNILQKILLITDKAREESQINYLFDMVYCIIELLVEIIQGNKEEIINNKKHYTVEEVELKVNSTETFKQFVQIVTELLFDNSLDAGRGFEVRLLLMSFFISILEEKNNEDAQKIIMKFLTLNRVLASIIYTLKSYFYVRTKDDPNFALYYADYTDKQIEQKEFVLDYTLYEYFEDIYFHTDFSKVSEEFQLSNNYYKYIKLLSINNKLPEAAKIIKQAEALDLNESKKKFNLFNKKILKSNKVAPINLINEKERVINIDTIEHYYTIRFFEKITKIVEVRIVEEEKRSQLVIFTIPSEMIYLSEMTKLEFEHYVDRESEISKKNELLKNIPLFLKEIKYYKKRKPNAFVNFLHGLDYEYVQWFVYLYAVAFNILMIITLEGYKGIEESSDINTRRRRRRLNPLQPRSLIPVLEKFSISIDLSIDDWGLIYDALSYSFCVINGLFIISWIAVRFPLYYKLDVCIYLSENKISKSQLSIWNKLYISIIETIWGRDYITTLTFMFALSLVGSIMNRGEIIYSFFLLAIVDLNPTLKNIVNAIKMRYSELGASFLLMICLVYLYSNLGFFFLNEDYSATIESSQPDDNYCYSLVFCFLTNIDAGVRARGGAADQMVRISYERHTFNYVVRLIYDVSYFLIVIIIMIELVFGIIIGTFSEMRSNEIRVEIDKENHCFICHVTRELAEKSNREEDFTHHRNVTHYLWTYVEYMIFLKLSNLHDLNAANAYARTNMDRKNICFLPTYKDLGDDNENEKNKKKGNEEEKEEVEEDSEDDFREKDEDDEDDEDGSGSSEGDSEDDKGNKKKSKKNNNIDNKSESEDSEESDEGKNEKKNYLLINKKNRIKEESSSRMDENVGNNNIRNKKGLIQLNNLNSS